MPLPRTTEPPRRIQIQHVEPQVDHGRYAVKRTQGERVEVSATIFRDGHEILGAAVRARRRGERRWRESLMYHAGNDRWVGHLELDACGMWEFAVAAWVDRFASWRHELQRKVDAGQEDLSSELSEGAALFGVESLTVEEALANAEADRSELATSPTLGIDVDRERARFGSWYELFPRSWGGFAGVTEVLPDLAELGFDVLYLPPVHPIGTTNRKGRNNALEAGPDDPGSPWAIGSEEGGHDAINPELGTLEEFEAMVARGREVGCEICLDFAIQCSPDHPWLKEHPEWFNRRPDGTLKYAENPPKKYQDIYNVNWDSRGLEGALAGAPRRRPAVGRPRREGLPRRQPAHEAGAVLGVADPGDPLARPGGGLLRRGVHAPGDDADARQGRLRPELHVLHLEEHEVGAARVRDRPARVERPTTGRTSSRTRRTSSTATCSRAAGPRSRRGSSSPARSRRATASTPGTSTSRTSRCARAREEYLDSEKYEAKERALDGPLLPLVRRLNAIRREHPALQWLDLAWLDTESDDLLAFAKKREDDVVIVAVNLNPFEEREGVVVLPAWIGLPPAVRVRELLTDEAFTWHIGRNYVRLGPGQSHVLGGGALRT